MVKKYFRTNNQIRSEKVRLIDEKGKQSGIISIEEALQKAKAANLDLVEIAPLAKPPVVKIINFSKFRYRQAKQERKQKVKQKKSETKGVRVSIRTSQHDMDFKSKQAEKFLSKGYRVKIDIILKGREKSMRPLANEKLRKFLDSIAKEYKIIQEIKHSPSGLNTTIAPKGTGL